MSLATKHVVIVGGSSEIGLAIARSVLAASGAVTLIACDEAKLKKANASFEDRATTDFRDEKSSQRRSRPLRTVSHSIPA